MKKIGIIGYGNMGSCIGKRLHSLYELWAFDKDSSKINDLPNVNQAATMVDLVQRVDVVVLAVKPQDFSSVLDDLKGDVGEKLIISIAAGVPTSYIENYLGNVRVVRVMPNMPARIAKAMTCLCKGAHAKEEDLSFAKELFDTLGETLVINEDMMDAATAISGSGPGYYYDKIENEHITGDDRGVVERFNEVNRSFIKELSECATNLGFDTTQAIQLAQATTNGSYALLKASNLSPGELKKQITSEGGTTAAGLEELHKKEGTLEKATKAARDRAKELSKK